MSRYGFRSGPLNIPHEEQQTQLEEEGYVVVFRITERTTGNTWWRDNYSGSKKGDVVIEELRNVDSASPSALQPYLSRSGFGNVYSWQIAIKKQMGELKPGILYKAAKRRND